MIIKFHLRHFLIYQTFGLFNNKITFNEKIVKYNIHLEIGYFLVKYGLFFS